MIKSKNRRKIIAETAKASQTQIEKKKRSIKQEIKIMASNKTLVPEAKEALEKFKMEAASEVGVNLTQGYNGDLTSRQAGSVGGQMVKKMIESYENSIKNNK
jgi:small acid-soluble spore protein D (minor alpha/beta-type SASP)